MAWFPKINSAAFVSLEDNSQFDADLPHLIPLSSAITFPVGPH